MILVSLYLTSLSILISGSIPAAEKGIILFSVIAEEYSTVSFPDKNQSRLPFLCPIYVTHLYPFICSRIYSDCFHALIIKNGAAMSMNLFTNRNRLTDLENELMVTRKEKVGRRDRLEVSVDKYTLLHLKQITNKDLPHSTRNSD